MSMISNLYYRTKRVVHYVILLAILPWLVTCTSPKNEASEEPPMASADFGMPKIDFHAHYRADRDYLIPLLDSFNLKAVLVDVGRVDTERWHQARQGLIDNFQKHPDRYFFCTSFTANGIDDDNYAEKIIEHIEHDLSLGARMVKVWKNFGMVSTDDSGNYVHIDDERIQPVWDYLTEQGIPVLAHIGEPLQAWRPLDDENPHAGYYRRNPQYHAYQHPEIPSWEAIQEARNNWLARNPDLVVVGAHHGSMSHDVNLIAQTLDKYPNFNVEPAARFGDLIRQDSDAVREFIIKYQDRFLYGTDLGVSGEASEMTAEELQQEKQQILNMMGRHWLYFTESGPVTFDTHFLSAPKQVQGLNLPDEVLRKIYYQNAMRILGGSGN